MRYIFIVLPITSFVLILLIIRSMCYSFLLNHKSKLLILLIIRSMCYLFLLNHKSKLLKYI